MDPEEIFNQSTPSPFEIHEDWDLDTWEASADLIQAYPYYKSGKDLDGLPGMQHHLHKWLRQS